MIHRVLNHFSLRHHYMTDPSTINNQSSSLYNVQPTYHTSKPRIFHSLPYTKETRIFRNIHLKFF